MNKYQKRFEAYLYDAKLKYSDTRFINYYTQQYELERHDGMKAWFEFKWDFSKGKYDLNPFTITRIKTPQTNG